MEQYLLENPNKNKIEIEKLRFDENTQDYTLSEGMPIISRLNMKSLDVMNNEMFVCNKIKVDCIEISNEFKKLSIPIEKFNKMFLLAFCITTHKSQGLSLNKPYCIYEYDKFDKRLKYVALSRATKFEYINILK
jgi:ATP-dependent exoDNAse (exonuclease V) alpha subunit